jgi:hypothetical protein
MVAKPKQVIDIYALCEPDSGRVRYVGKSVNAATRFKEHLNNSRKHTRVGHWIQSLAGIPELRVLCQCANADWESVEREVISQYREDHQDLLNICDGGLSPDLKSARANGAAHKHRKDKHLFVHIRRLGIAALDCLNRGEIEAALRLKYCALLMKHAKNEKREQFIQLAERYANA